MAVAKIQIGKDLEQMSRILDDTAESLQVVFDDLVKGNRADTGRQGLTAEQVMRCAVRKQYRQLSYEELAFQLDDGILSASSTMPCRRWESVKSGLLHRGLQYVKLKIRTSRVVTKLKDS